MRDDELYVMLMLQRSEANADNNISDEENLLACMEACDANDEDCIAACYDEEDVDPDAPVLAGDLDVTANANNGSIIVGVPSDTDTLTFKTSEEVEVTKVTLKRYGFSANTDIANVWLEDDGGKVISNKKPINSKGLATLTIDKDYRTIDGTLNATIVVQTRANLTGAGVTMGFKVTEVESTAANTNLPSKDPTTYGIINYDGSKVVASVRAGSNEYNYAEGESYEVAKFKVKAADDAAILVNGFTLTDTATDISKLGDVIDDVVVSIDNTEVKGLEFSTDKKKLSVSFDDVKIDAKKSANITLSVSLKDFENHFGHHINFSLAGSDFNAIEETTKVRISLTDNNGNAIVTLPLQTNVFNGGKVKYTSTKLAKVEAAAGATDVVIAEGSIEIPETVLATFKVNVPRADIIEEMRMYVAGEEFDGDPVAGGFSFSAIELTKGGKVQFKVDIKDDAPKGTKLSLGTVSLNNVVLTYDSNGDPVTEKAGSFSFADLTVVEAKASLENNADDTVEFIAGETNRKVVFDGTYTAKKADVYLKEFTITGAPAIRTITGDGVEDEITFYLYLDGEEVAEVDALSQPEDFSSFKVEAGKSISVKIEAEVDAGNKKTTSNYAFTLALDGEDVDDLPVTTATATLAEMAVVEKGSVSVAATTEKATVLLKKANTTIASFTVKPDKSDDTYLESLAFTVIKDASVNLTADDVNVKIDGVAEDGETAYDDAPEYTGQAVANKKLVTYNGIIYQNKKGAEIAAGDWATNSGDFTQVPEFSGDVANSNGDYVMYNGLLYKANADHTASTAWDSTKWDVQANHVVFDLTEELSSNGVTVEVILKNKTAGTIVVDVDDLNGKDPNKAFTKRFEDALVWVASQKDNKGSTTFTLGVSKAESSDEITKVCLWTDTTTSECATSVSDGNDDIEWTPTTTQQTLIKFITYTVNVADTTTCNPTNYSAAGCVMIDREHYTDYFKVGDTYAKVFGIPTN